MENIFSQEIIYNTLIHMSFHDIIQYCNTHRGAMVVCNDKYFWLSKLDYDFVCTSSDGIAFIPSKYVNTYNSSNETGKQIYMRWVKMMKLPTDYVNHETIDDNWDVSIFKLQSDATSSNKNALGLIYTYATMRGNINVLSALPPRPNILITAANAQYGGSSDILHWLETHGMDEILIEIFSDLNKWQNYLDQIEIGAIVFGNLNVLNKLIKMGKTLNPDNVLFAIQGGNLNILQLFYEHYPNTFTQTHDNIFEGIDLAISSNLPNILNILQWLLEHGIIPGQSTVIRVLEQNRIDILDWLNANNIYPNNDDIIRNMPYLIIPTLNWLAYHGTVFTTIHADFAARGDNIEALDWLAQRSIFPTKIVKL